MCAQGLVLTLSDGSRFSRPAPSSLHEAGGQCSKARRRNAAWDPFLALDPGWKDAFVAMGVGIYGSGVLPPKDVELLSVAVDGTGWYRI